MWLCKLKKMLQAGLGTGALLYSGIVLAQELRYNMPKGVTPISREIYGLHMLIFWVCVAIGVVVFSVLFYSIFKYRKSRGVTPAQFHEHTSVEVVWTIIPFLILIGMAIPATRTLIAMEDTSNPDLTIQVTGSQWKWKYDYLDNGVSYYSNLATPMEQRDNRAAKGEHYLLEVDRPMVVPTNQKIRILTTSTDVIHSWWVPELGVKKDAMPGFINESWALIEQPGIYRGQCAELCGVGHAYMPVVVQALPPAEFAAWVDEQKKAQEAELAAVSKEMSMDELMARGEQVYTTHCAVCHQATGQGVPGVFPALQGGPIATGPVEGHLNIVLNGGRPGTAMPAFAQQLSDADIAAVVTFERNSWGNKTGDTVQAKDVKAARTSAAR